MRVEDKHHLKKLRHWRIRQKVSGTAERPRMSVHFSGRNIHIQFIDDVAGKTLAAVSTLSKATPNREKMAANQQSGVALGKFAAETAKSKGITQVIFDRSGSRYHGKVKALADAAREAGLKF